MKFLEKNEPKHALTDTYKVELTLEEIIWLKILTGKSNRNEVRRLLDDKYINLCNGEERKLIAEMVITCANSDDSVNADLYRSLREFVRQQGLQLL